jgi:signal transduction histidine kinase
LLKPASSLIPFLPFIGQCQCKKGTLSFSLALGNNFPPVKPGDLLYKVKTNAVKYNVSGNPRIIITFEEAKEALIIRFRDNGIGLTREEKKNIYKKFYQGHRPGINSIAGSGIGLYLVQQIARLHRGKIIAESEGEGKGSLFTLTLPYERQEGDEG